MRSTVSRPAGFALLAVVVGAFGVARLPPAAAPPPKLPTVASDAGTGGHLPFGPVIPARALPDLTLAMDDGSARRLLDATRGGWTLVQIIFTQCRTSCPLQGAIFQSVQRLLAERGLPAKLLSISVDPARDDASALRNWLGEFDAGPTWRAGTARADDLDKVVAAFFGPERRLDVHDARVYFVDPAGRLAFVTEDLPDPEALARLLRAAVDRPAP
jgi:protein SCO1/2